jgi:tryptophan synthase alpha chain
MFFTPTSTDARMTETAGQGGGFIYCVARKGVTGQQTTFSEALEDYLARCRQATDLPLALGFGVKDRSDIDFLRGKADIAVIGTETIRLVDEHGVGAVEGFIRGLQP